MSQLILGVHSGSHDAAAALFDDYELKAAISLERLTRNKGDGAYPDLADSRELKADSYGHSFPHDPLCRIC